MIQIVCKKPGFRRAGQGHPASAVYEDGTFTKAQLAALKAEPMLVVTELPNPAVKPKAEDPDKTEPKAKKA